MYRSIRHGLVCLTLLVGCLGVGVQAFAYTSPGTPNGYVNDFADVLTTEQEKILSDLVHEHRLKTSDEIAIVTVSSTAEESIEQYAVKLFEEWGIGRRDQDNGVLLLLAIADRRLRIEVGYGLESVLTDSRSARIISGATGSLKQQDYSGAIQQMTREIIAAVENKDQVFQSTSPEPVESGRSELFLMVGTIVFTLLLIFLPIPIVLFIAKRQGKKISGGWGSGGESSSSTFFDSSSSSSASSSSDYSSGSSGSSDTFSGGSSGGGGASGSW